MPEGRILRGDFAPQVERPTGPDIIDILAGLVLPTNGGVLHVAAVGNEEIIVLCQIQELLAAIRKKFHTPCDLFPAVNVKAHIHDLGVEMEVYAVALQVLDYGEDHGLILVILCEAQGPQVGQAVDMVDKALHVAFHLQRAVAVVEGKHCPPVCPEVAVKHFCIQHIRDAFFLQLFIRREDQACQLHGSLVAEAEFSICVGVLPLLLRHPAEGVVGVSLVQPVILIENTDTLRLNRGDGAEQIPHDLEMVIHFAAAAHDIADLRIVPSVACAACNRITVEEVNVFSGHLCVAHQEASGGKGGKTRTDKVGRFVFDPFRLQGPGKGFIISTGIVHEITSF